MNERIKELVRECGGYAKDDDGGETKIAVLIGKDVEMFAELIVRECLYNMENCDGDLDFAIWKTKQDFGVKE